MEVQSIQFLQTGRQLPPRYNLTIQNYVDILLSFNNLLDFDQRQKKFCSFLLKENIKLLELNTLVKRQYLPHIDQVKVSMVTHVVNRTFLSLHEGSITPEVPL